MAGFGCRWSSVSLILFLEIRGEFGDQFEAILSVVVFGEVVVVGGEALNRFEVSELLLFLSRRGRSELEVCKDIVLRLQLKE